MICKECPLNKQVGNIRNLENFVDNLWPWDVFNDCFINSDGKHSGIAFSDLDGIVERKGDFIVVEGKGIGVSIPPGQRRMFWHLVNTGRFTIVILWGEPGIPTEYEVFTYSNGPTTSGKQKCNLEQIKQLIKNWYSIRE